MSGEARPRPCRVQRVIVCFRLYLWLFWFSNYKEMSSLDRQELVEKPPCWGGNRGTQIRSAFDGKESSLVTLLAGGSQPPPPVSSNRVICRVPLGRGGRLPEFSFGSLLTKGSPLALSREETALRNVTSFCWMKDTKAGKSEFLGQIPRKRPRPIQKEAFSGSWEDWLLSLRGEQ